MAKELNIGFFTDTYHPHINGVVSSIDIFKNELEALGHNVYIFGPKINWTDKDQENNVFRFRSVKLFFHDELVFPMPFSFNFFRKFPKIKLDIIHSHTPFSLGLIAQMMGFLKTVPVVHTYHTLYPEYVKAYLPRSKKYSPSIVKKLSRTYCNHCNLIIAPSPKLKDLLIEYGIKKRISVLPTGIDLNNFKEQSNNFIREKYNISQNEKVLLFVGRIGKEKNIDFLIDGFEKLCKNIDLKLKFLIIGDGPAKNDLEKKVKENGIDDKVIFTGYLKRQEVIKACFESDCFVFSSQTDTQGMVLLEAMAAGLPIVALQDRAFSNIIINSKTGFLVKDNKEFVEKVSKILKNNKLAENLSLSALERIRDFSAREQTLKLVDFYLKLIKK